MGNLQTDTGTEYLLVTPGNSLYFPAVDFIKQFVGHAGVREGSSQLPVVVDCRFVLGADFTAAKVIKNISFYFKFVNIHFSNFPLSFNYSFFKFFQGIAALIGEFNNRKQALYFYNPRADVVAVLKGACGEDFQYVSTQEELSYLLKPRLGIWKFFTISYLNDLFVFLVKSLKLGAFISSVRTEFDKIFEEYSTLKGCFF